MACAAVVLVAALTVFGPLGGGGAGGLRDQSPYFGGGEGEAWGGRLVDLGKRKLGVEGSGEGKDGGDGPAAPRATLKVFQAHPSVLTLEDAGTARKDLNRARASVTGESRSSVVDGSLELEHHAPDLAEMRSYLSSGVGRLGGDPAGGGGAV